MKKLKKPYLVLIFTMAFILAIAPNIPALSQFTRVYATPPHPSTQMRGVWVTSVYNLDFPSRRNMSAAEMRNEIDNILARVHALGMNAVFVQVRPSADALYRSDIFPWSHQLTGTRGQVPPDNFDPLAYWVQQAHALGIQVHAWINPYRITHRSENITDVNQLPQGHPARENPTWAISYGGALFFDPGNPAVRQLIADGVAEIMHNYNVDGIHLDDYFYPSRNFTDNTSFARYGAGQNLHDWRRENVNAMIRLLQSTVRQINPNVRFGISPTAIWMNSSTDPRGSNTRGMESFHSLYADTRRWVLEGWVDYIAPQIYWYAGHDRADYEIVLSWWEDLTAGTNVDLYVGLAIYREVLNWANWNGEIVRQLNRNARSSEVRGSIFFRSSHMFGPVGDRVGQFYAQQLSFQPPSNTPPPENTPEPETTPDPETTPEPETIQEPENTPEPTPYPTVVMDNLLVAQPSGNPTVRDAAGFNFFGSAVPDMPLYVNGQLVTNRTAEGFFSIFMPLTQGANTFTFTQEGQSPVTRTVTNGGPVQATPPPTMASPAITNAAPAANVWGAANSPVTLRATAPAGATVRVEIGGETIQLTQSNPNLTSAVNNIVAAQFTGQFVPNANIPDDAIVEIGRPIYTMTWNSHTATATADGRIYQIGPYAPFYAEVTAESAWVFPQAALTGGSHWMVHRGQRDRVISSNGYWTRLQSGMWVESSNLRTWKETTPPCPLVAQAGLLSEGRYIAYQHEDVIVWNTTINPVAYAEFDGRELIVTIGMQNILPPIFYAPDTTIFEDIRIGEHNGVAAYFMMLRPHARLEGFYFQHKDDELRLVLRKRRALTKGDYPLEGFSFVLDAGHGGSDPGALGPMGSEMAESHIVLANTLLLAERLQMLGADVSIVRDDDVLYSLQERVDFSRNVKPDMFISIHANSTAETTNATNIHGFTVWHRNPNSLPLAEFFLDRLHYINPMTTRHRTVHQANFFVCRPVWAPAVIVEISFMNNIQDFAWMICPHNQSEFAWGMVNAILGYFQS